MTQSGVARVDFATFSEKGNTFWRLYWRHITEIYIDSVLVDVWPFG